MKHVVELKYTNPSHEHVSLRRRVETINRVVEAQNAEEALNRAANQQRALGFRIQSANVVEQKVEEPTTEVLSEDVELEEGKVAKALAVGAMALASMGAKAHTDTTKSVAQLAHERPALAQRLHDIGASGQVPASDKRAAELQRKQDQEMPASERRAKELKKEDVELDETNMRFDYEAAARPKSSDVKNFLNRDKNARAAAASKKYIRRMTKLGGLGPNQTKKDTEAHMKAHFEEVEQVDEAAKTKKEKLKALLYRDRSNVREFGKGAGLTDAQKAAARKAIANEEAELDEAKKPLKPTYWRAEWRLGTQTEVDKNNKKIYDRLAKTDPAKATAFHDNLMKMKKKDMKEETGADKRDAGYKMPAHIKAAQAKSDALSKVVKRPQAGTLAAAKMKKEAVDPGSMKVVNKRVKAAEKMINAAKGKVNKVDLKPTLDLEKHKSSE